MAERSTGARQSDEEILAALDAAPDAFPVFYRRHVAELLREFTGRTNNPRLAAELCAETFAAALAGVHRFDPSHGSAASWLLRIAERELAHAERAGTARDRARRRLGLAALEPPLGAIAGLAVAARQPASAAAADLGPPRGGFAAALEEELVEAARFRAERRSRRRVVPRPSRTAVRAALACAAAIALAVVASALVLRGGDDPVAGERSVPPPPPSTSVRLQSMQPLAPCGEPARHRLGHAGAIDGIALLRRSPRAVDPLPFAPRMLPVGSIDPRSTRRATHTRLWSTVHVVPSLDVAAGGRCGPHVGPGLCLVAEEREFRCFTAAGVERGTAVARTSAATVLGIVPDGVDRVTIQGDGPPVGAEVVDNVYEARLDAPAGRPLRLGFGRSIDDGCRRTVAPELLAEVALLRDRAQPGYELPPSAHAALRHWRLDAVVEEGARYWGGGGSVDFWAVPVVPRGRAECAPATRACVVAVPEHARAAAQCARRGAPDWSLGQLLREHAVIFGTVPDGVTGVRVEHHGATVGVPAHDNVFGGVLPFGYRAKDRPRLRLLRGDATVKPRVGIVDAGGLVGDVVGRLQARGYETLGEITPGVMIQPGTSVYWWPGRAARGDALQLAHAVAASGVVPIADTERVPRPVLDTHAPVVVVVGER